MSVPDNQLDWWKPANQPDGTRCDRNGCGNQAIQQVAWRHMGMRDRQKTRVEWRHIACHTHAEWWIQSSGAVRTHWTADLR